LESVGDVDRPDAESLKRADHREFVLTACASESIGESVVQTARMAIFDAAASELALFRTERVVQ
jgi:hypothetical protein